MAQVDKMCCALRRARDKRKKHALQRIGCCICSNAAPLRGRCLRQLWWQRTQIVHRAVLFPGAPCHVGASYDLMCLQVTNPKELSMLAGKTTPKHTRIVQFGILVGASVVNRVAGTLFENMYLPLCPALTCAGTQDMPFEPTSANTRLCLNARHTALSLACERISACLTVCTYHNVAR